MDLMKAQMMDWSLALKMEVNLARLRALNLEEDLVQMTAKSLVHLTEAMKAR